MVQTYESILEKYRIPYYPREKRAHIPTEDYMQKLTVMPGTHKSLGSVSNMITQGKVAIVSARV